jgi:NADPH:quinone reductase-like Zn-dependent oxidoreductase
MGELGILIKQFPAILGCDVSGEVVEVGDDVKNVKVGDLVYAYNPLGTPKFGTFAEFCLVEGFAAHKIPNGFSITQASTISVGSLTAYLALFWRENLGLNNENGHNQYVLVWGGSSSVGMNAVQLLSGLGYRVLSTCSAKHLDYVISLGASLVFDYTQNDVMDQIREATNGQLRYSFDCVGDEKSYLVLAGEEQSFVAMTSVYKPPQNLPKNVKSFHVNLGGVYGNREAVTFINSHCPPLIERLVGEGKYVAPNIDLFEGIDNIKEALLRQKKGVSGIKVVVKMQ